MSRDTVPVFVVGSGRSGTRMIFKLLSGVPNIEVHHEYLCTHVQPLAAEYFMGLITKEATKQSLQDLHGSAIHYSGSAYFVDCSNKLSWIIEPLFEMHPNARFIHITRDGRKVCSSFFHKLAPEIYDDASVGILQHWLQNRDLPKPPPEKKYWWNIPQAGQPFADEFKTFDQFQRICYHWREAIRVINEAFAQLPRGQTLTVKLEELTSSKDTLARFLSIFDIEYDDQYYEFVQTPQNVFFPMDFGLTDDQNRAFYQIAGDSMRLLGYQDTEVYTVRY